MLGAALFQKGVGSIEIKRSMETSLGPVRARMASGSGGPSENSL